MVNPFTAPNGEHPHSSVTSESGGSPGPSEQGVEMASPAQAPVQVNAGKPPMKDAGSTTIPLIETEPLHGTPNVCDEVTVVTPDPMVTSARHGWKAPPGGLTET